MTRKEYVMRALQALDEGRINEDTYDLMLMNTGFFCDDDDDEEDQMDNLPGTYAEVDTER